jgi:hypothetical protein
MFATVTRDGTMDRLGIALSGLCAVHCVVSVVFVTMLASAGGFLLDPIFHEVGLMMAIGLGIVAIGRGVLEHGFMMPASIAGLGLGVMAGALSIPHGGGSAVYAVLGVALLALAHDLNRRAVI